ncbi:hypothetical protein MKX07_002812 [Trichoderma sp. CBMAI-0711]|nr:hypothetical protein MKX07_002812 [Trichoderma sp. CBMAI-0711]
MSALDGSKVILKANGNAHDMFRVSALSTDLGQASGGTGCMRAVDEAWRKSRHGTGCINARTDVESKDDIVYTRSRFLISAR